MQELERTTFTTNRLLEFFTEKELQMQIGHDKYMWPIALSKELIDNALDACETSSVAPEISVIVEKNAIKIQDNGPGLPIEVLERSLDYLIRVSDKTNYISPTRGQLGNALKCVWAAPYVANGEHGHIEVVTGGMTHSIDVRLNRIEQKPQIQLSHSHDGEVKKGTLIKIEWARIADYLFPDSRFYSFPPICTLLENYAAFNPHASFSLVADGVVSAQTIQRTIDASEKWLPSNPTSPHWYTVESLRGLIAAYIADERNGGRAKTVREFVSEFSGLSSVTKQKAITDATGLSRAYLHDLIVGVDVDNTQVGKLLVAMQEASREIKPRALGVIGESHLIEYMVTHCYIERESVKYKKVEDVVSGVPFVLEIALGIYTKNFSECGRRDIIGLNFSPTLKNPFRDFDVFLERSRADITDPLCVVAHLASPRMDYTDRGKSVVALPSAILQKFEGAIKSVASAWTVKKRHADSEGRMRERELDELRRVQKRRELTIKDAAYRVMEEGYTKASANRTLPANARQIMYAARPLVLELTDGRCWKKSSYFTQTLLPNYVDANPDTTAEWDVVFDARGKLLEPHTNMRVDLGSLEVRRYIQNWFDDFDENININDFDFAPNAPTIGPTNRYSFALFIEKEGFNPLFERIALSDRFDIAVMSTKGMSVTAARRLVEELSLKEVTILVLHDFDKAGFSIVHTLRSNTRRYQFSVPPNILDIGLRLADVDELSLQSERVEYDCKVNPKVNLFRSGATEKECDFLVRSKTYTGKYVGERVELNAMTSDQLVSWLERKLEAVGVWKLVPQQDVLEKAYRRAFRRVGLQRIITKLLSDYRNVEIDVPVNLMKTVQAKIKGNKNSWDMAIWELCDESCQGAL